jgi:hypothetical protein
MSSMGWVCSDLRLQILVVNYRFYYSLVLKISLSLIYLSFSFSRVLFCCELLLISSQIYLCRDTDLLVSSLFFSTMK